MSVQEAMEAALRHPLYQKFSDWCRDNCVTDADVDDAEIWSCDVEVWWKCFLAGAEA